MKPRTAKRKAAPRTEKPTSAKLTKRGLKIAVAPMTHDDPTDNRPDPMEVDGSKARQRLDRPRRKAFAGGGEVRGPTPSLKQATNGIKVDHPAFKTRDRERYADGGDVTDGLQQFRNIERAFGSNDDGASAPPLRSLSNDSSRLAQTPVPYSGQNKTWVVPSLEPIQALQQYKQMVTNGPPRGFAQGGDVGGARTVGKPRSRPR